MGNNFNDKIKDFSGWSKTSFEFFNKGYYADSLTNMRKCGESACKLMILNRYSERISVEKIGNKNYKDLIELIIKENLAPRKVINWLETLQIHGNEATHDKQIIQEQSYYGVIALRLLITWIYNELLKSSVPSELEKGILQFSEKPAEINNDKRFMEERQKLLKEKEELEKILEKFKGEKKQEQEKEKEKIAQLEEDLKRSELKINELDSARKQIISLETELTRLKSEPTELKEKKSDKKKLTKRLLFFSLPAAIIIAILLIFILPEGHKETVKKDNTVNQKTDSFIVLILPLTILEENPNISIKFEEALASRIRQKALDLKLPLKVIYNPDTKYNISSQDDAYKEGQKENAIVVFWGELYEPSGNDSAQVNIKDILIRNEKPSYDVMGVKSFSKLSDSSAIRIMQEAECVVALTIVENYIVNKKYSDALALLYNTAPVSKSQKSYYYNYLAECHSAQKNYNAAIIELEKYIKLEPENGYPYAFLANTYTNAGELDKADIYFQKSLAIEPNNVNTLMNYASMLAKKDKKNAERARALLLNALEYDTSNAMTWYYLADVENFMKDFNSAKLHYEKSLEIDPDIDGPKMKLAEILAFDFGEPEKAIVLANQILAKDSNNIQALFLLGNIYSTTKVRNGLKAEYYFKKCEEIKKGTNTFSINFGLGMAALNKKDYKTALLHLLKSYSENSTDPELNNYIGQTYMAIGDYANAEKFLTLTYQLDSSNYLYNYNLATFYYYAKGKYQNITKATYYYEKELITYPYDILALLRLCEIYISMKDFKKLRKTAERLNSVAPENPNLFKIYGVLAETDSNFTNALYYYKKAADLFKDDAECLYKTAFLMLYISPKNYKKEALFYAGVSIQLQPQSPGINYVYAKALYNSGDINKSLEYYKKTIEIDKHYLDDEFEQLIKKRGY